MNHLRLLEWIGGLDEDLLERSERPIPLVRKIPAAHWIAAAACLCLVCGLVMGAFDGMKKAMDSSNGMFAPGSEAETPEDGPLQDSVDDGEADKNSQDIGTADTESWGLHLVVTDATGQGATLIFAQKGGDVSGELTVGSGWLLQIWQDGQWKDVPTIIPKDEIAWDTVAYNIPLGGELVMPISWEHVYGTLDAGQYRIVVTVVGQREEKTYCADFAVKG